MKAGCRGAGKMLLLPVMLVLCLFLWYVPCALSSMAADNPAPPAGVSMEIALLHGERMYREGVLPSGEPMQSVVKGDIPVSGTVFTCVSCHMRSGLGSNEGQVLTPPTNGNKLFQPLTSSYKGVYLSSLPPSRPAYSDESLAEVLRSGVDPSGRILNDIMPRYILEDTDMALLIFYLKSLSAQLSPGVSDTTLRFATIIHEDVSPEKRDAMLLPLVPLENYVVTKYSLRTQPARPRAAADPKPASEEVASRTITLSRWILKGPPDTWRMQLEEYNRRDPVFALVGGITTGEWKPIHDFCEATQIPSLFPITDFPVVSESDTYTMYFSKGYYQEGEGAARYLNGMDELLKGRAVVQIVRASREGQALSEGFEKTWLELGHQAPVTVTLKAGETLTEKFLQQVLADEKPVYLLLWAGPETLPALETLTTWENRPGMVFVSSGYLGESIWTIKETDRDVIHITYPFRLPQEELKYTLDMERQMRNTKVRGDTQAILKRSYSVIRVLTRAIMDMKENYYRDHFLDVITMMADQKVPLYERLSFGPGQRYASKGCYIVQLSKGPAPELIRKSDWVVH